MAAAPRLGADATGLGGRAVPARAPTWTPKSEGPWFGARAPRRQGRCRVSALTVWLVCRLHRVGALAVVGEVETFALLLDRDSQTDQDVHHLVDDEGADAAPDQRQQHALDLGQHLGRELVIGDLADLVVHDAGAAERGVHQNAGEDRA